MIHLIFLASLLSWSSGGLIVKKMMQRWKQSKLFEIATLCSGFQTCVWGWGSVQEAVLRAWRDQSQVKKALIQSWFVIMRMYFLMSKFFLQVLDIYPEHYLEEIRAYWLAKDTWTRNCAIMLLSLQFHNLYHVITYSHFKNSPHCVLCPINWKQRSWVLWLDM